MGLQQIGVIFPSEPWFPTVGSAQEIYVEARYGPSWRVPDHQVWSAAVGCTWEQSVWYCWWPKSCTILCEFILPQFVNNSRFWMAGFHVGPPLKLSYRWNEALFYLEHCLRRSSAINHMSTGRTKGHLQSQLTLTHPTSQNWYYIKSPSWAIIL